MLAFGGDEPSKSAKTEDWDGSSWTEVADLSTARRGATATPAGTSSLALYAAGNSGSYVSVTEEWDAPAVFNQIQEGQLYFNSTTNTFKETITDIPGTSWGSGGALNSPRENMGGAGVTTAQVSYGGVEPPGSTTGKTEEYNGSTWTEKNDLNTSRRAGGSAGSAYTAALYFGGQGPPPKANNESWNGTSWTELTDLNTARTQGGLGNMGTTTDAMLACGEPNLTNVEIWDGSSWTEVAEVNTGRQIFASAASTTPVSIIAGGYTSTNQTGVELFDGTSWTETTEINTARRNTNGSGDSTSSLVFGGRDPSSDTGKTEFWNGSSWTELNDLSTARNGLGGSGTSVNAIAVSGSSNATEEWLSGLGNKTISAS
jgi:hypothetical protein